MTTSSQPALLKGQGLPEYAAITPDQVSAEMPGLMKALEADFEALEHQHPAVHRGPDRALVYPCNGPTIPTDLPTLLQVGFHGVRGEGQ